MESKHTAYDMKQMQGLPLEAKIIMTKRRIEQWYDHWEGEVYVSFSGGKDSTVLKHIVDSMFSDVPAVFVNTGLEYPEIQHFVKEVKSGKYDCFNSDVVIVRPEMRFDEVIKKYGYPAISKEIAQNIHEVKRSAAYHGISCRETAPYNRKFNPESEYCKKYPNFTMIKWDYLVDSDFDISHRCCDVMKKKPAKIYEKDTGRKPIIATMATESRLRYADWMKYGCNAFEKGRPKSQPMSFWTEQDVLHYLKKFNVPYCSVYGEIQAKQPAGTDEGQLSVFDGLFNDASQVLETTGCHRTGCIFCMFGCHNEKNPNRFQMLKQTHPRQYEYCINGGEMVDGKWQPTKEGLGLGHVLDYIGVRYD